MLISFEWRRDAAFPTQRLSLTFGEGDAPPYSTEYEKHKYLYANGGAAAELRLCVGVTSGETEVALDFSRSAAPRVAANDGDRRLVAAVAFVEKTLNELSERERSLAAEERAHLAFNAQFDRRLENLTFAEIAFLFGLFALEFAVFAFQIRRKRLI